MSSPVPGSARVPRRSRGARATRRLASILLAFALWMAPVASHAGTGAIVYDLAVVRPVAAGHLLVGSILFVPAGLLSLPSGTVGEAFRTFVQVPSIDLMVRPLGEF